MSITINRTSSETSYENSNRIPSDRDLTEIRDRLGKHVAKAMEKIATIGEHCKNNHQSQNSLLNTGFWYPEDMAFALKDLGTSSALKRYEFLKEQGMLITGRLPPAFFKSVKKQGSDTCKEFEWTLLPGHKPSKVLAEAKKGFEEIKNGFALIDCGAAVTLARHIGLLHYLEETNGPIGIEKFDRYFSSPHGRQMNIGYADEETQPMRYLIRFTDVANQLSLEMSRGVANDKSYGTLGARPVKIGQVVGLNGVSKHDRKMPFNQASNFNVVCNDETLEKQLFTGHGLPGRGISEVEVYRLMAQEYNRKPDHEIRIPSARLEESKLLLWSKRSRELENDQVDLKHPEKVVRGYDPTSPQDFEPRLIYDIIQAPVGQISLDFIKQKPYVSKDYTDIEPTAAQVNAYFTNYIGRPIVRKGI
jgi:hypothetical protein